MEKKIRSNNPLVAVMATLIMAVGFLGYYAYDLKEQLGQEQAQQEALINEKEETYHKLDSISKEISQKAELIMQLGGKVEALLEMKKQLENEKYQLRLTKSISDEKYQKLKTKIDEYEKVLTQKDIEINVLKENNQLLLAQTQHQQDSISRLKETVKTLATQASTLSKKVKQAAQVHIDRLQVSALLKNGKERKEGEFKSNQLTKLKIYITVGQNPLLEYDTKQLFIKILEPDGATLFDMSQNNHKIKFTNDKEEFYTFHKEIIFDNTKQEIVQVFEKGNAFKKGVHKVELYCEGKIIAHTSFIIN